MRLFSGMSKYGIKSQQRENELVRQLISEMGSGARGDLLSLFPYMLGARQSGVQGALDVFEQTIPQQLQAMQTGNVGAQSMLLGGLPQIQNAILGLPVDYSGMQPQTIPYDASYSQVSFPDLMGQGDITQLLSGSMPQTGFNPFNPRIDGQVGINDWGTFVTSMK